MTFKIDKMLLQSLMFMCFVGLSFGHEKVTWTRWGNNGGIKSPFENKLVLGGSEGNANGPGSINTFVCRGTAKSSLLAGKMLPGLAGIHGMMPICLVASDDNREQNTPDFEVLELAKNMNISFEWIQGTGDFPKNAIKGGFVGDDEKLFICRTKQVQIGNLLWKGQGVLVGYTGKHTKGCHAPYGGGAVAYDDYQILVDGGGGEIVD